MHWEPADISPDLSTDSVVSQGEKREWVSVKDRLPEVHEEVLIWLYDTVVQSYLSASGYWMVSYDVTDAAADIQIYDRKIVKQGEALDYATHWMPLPKPPAVE